MFSQLRSRSKNKFQTRRGGLFALQHAGIRCNGSLDATVKYAWVTPVERGNLRFQLKADRDRRRGSRVLSVPKTWSVFERSGYRFAWQSSLRRLRRLICGRKRVKTRI